MNPPLSRMERLGRYFFAHPAFTAVTIISALLVLAGAVAFVFFRGEGTRDKADRIERIVTQSPCQKNPKGDECQAIFLASIRAFDRYTTCVLANKLLRNIDAGLVDCTSKHHRVKPSKEKSDGSQTSQPDKEVPRSRQGAVSQPGPSSGPSPGDSGPAPGPSPQPPPTSPPPQPGPNPPGNPPPPSPPEPPKPPSVGGGVGNAVDGVLEGDLPKAVGGAQEAVDGVKCVVGC